MVEGEPGGGKGTASPSSPKPAKRKGARTKGTGNGDDEKVRAIQTIVASKRFIVVAETEVGIQVLASWA